MKNIKISLPSIHCESCVKLIKMTLQGVDGINEVSIDLKTRSSNIKFNDNKINEEEILSLIREDAGYEAILIND